MKNIAKHAAIVAALGIIVAQRDEILQRCTGVTWQKIEASIAEIESIIGEPEDQSPEVTDMKALAEALAPSAEFMQYAKEQAPAMLKQFADQIAQGVADKMAPMLTPPPAPVEPAKTAGA